MRISKGAQARAAKAAPKPQKGAFRRAIEHFTKIGEAREANYLLGPVALQLALMALAGILGPYRSRGHGRGAPSRRYGNKAGRYRPHQGAREMERRRVGGFAQLRRREAGAL